MPLGGGSASVSFFRCNSDRCLLKKQEDIFVRTGRFHLSTLPCLFFGSRMPTWPAALASACSHLSFFVCDVSTARRACRAA